MTTVGSSIVVSVRRNVAKASASASMRSSRSKSDSRILRKYAFPKRMVQK